MSTRKSTIGILDTATALVKAANDQSTEKPALIVFGGGSQGTFITESLAEKIGAKARWYEELEVHPFISDKPLRFMSKVVDLDIKGANGKLIRITAYTSPYISKIHQPSAVDEIIRKTQEQYRGQYHPFADPITSDQTPERNIDILVGNDYLLRFYVNDSRQINDNLYVQKTSLGWMVSGRIEFINDPPDKPIPTLVLGLACKCIRRISIEQFQQESKKSGNKQDPISQPERIDWLVQPSKHGGNSYQELYFPGRFVPCWDDLYGNDTEKNSRQGQPYPYVPDELKCPIFDINNHDFNQQRLFKYANHVASKRPSIQLTHLTHFTNPDSFNAIKNDQLIKAFPKYLDGSLTGNGREKDYSFVWMTATVGSDDVDTIRHSINGRRREISHFLHYDSDRQAQFNFMAEESNYATSVPFTISDHPCGNRGFGFTIDDLIENYCRLVSPYYNSGCQYRCMGTFIYKKEVMFAVLAHPRTDGLSCQERSFFEKFPLLEKHDQDPKTVVYENNGRFYWKPFSTSARFNGVHQPVYCRWEQVAFAFYFPQKNIGFNLDCIDYRTY